MRRLTTLTQIAIMFWFAAVCSFLNSCTRDKYLFSETVVITAGKPFYTGSFRPGTYTFSNTGNSPVTFWFSGFNKVNYRNAETMVMAVTDSLMPDSSKAFNLWRLVSESGFHYSFEYNHHLPDNSDPLALNTFPYFLCGEKAGILAHLLEKAELKTRIVKLAGHIVVETFYNEAWHLFDADENVAFLKPDGQVASCIELAANLDWISEQNVVKSADSKFVGYNKYRKYFKQYYFEENQTKASEDPIPYNMDLQLYPGDKIRFQLQLPPSLIKFAFPRFLFCTSGTIVRSLLTTGPHVKMLTPTTWSITEQIPYYIKAVKIAGLTEINAQVNLVTQNRLTGTDTTYVMKRAGEKTIPSVEFNAPSSPDIYYKYRLEITGCTASDLTKLSLITSFEFNSLTFPLAKTQPVQIYLPDGDSLTLTSCKK